MWLKFQHWLVSILTIGVLLLAGCSAPQAATLNSTEASATQVSRSNMNLPVLEGNATVVMTVKGSPITIEVDGKQLKLSNLDKVLYPAAGFTKRQVIEY